MTEDMERNRVSPKREEGLRGDGNPHWYVVHTYSGHEDKVKANIIKQVETRNMGNRILDVKVPTETTEVIKNGRKDYREKKIFPGYVIVKMIIDNESWYLVRNTQGVTGFVGHGSNPVELSQEEVRRMGLEKIIIDLDLHPGDQIRVINGPLESMVGVVDEVNEEKETVRAKLSMFGRDTPVELEFAQIDKL